MDRNRIRSLLQGLALFDPSAWIPRISIHRLDSYAHTIYAIYIIIYIYIYHIDN